MASVLETFFILFQTDAEDVEEGAKKARGATDKLDESIGGADKGTVQLGKKFNNLATQAVAAFASVFAVTSLIAGAKGITTQSTELNRLSEILGESAAEIVNWGRAVESVGGDSSAFEGSLKSLNKSMAEALISGSSGASIALMKLGVSARDSNGDLRSILDLLPDIAKSFENLDRLQALSLGQELGLDEGTILLLMKGGRETERLVARQRKLNIVTDEQTAKLAALGIKWREYSNLLGSNAQVIVATLIPVFEMLERAFFDIVAVIQGNQELIMTFFTGLGIVLSVVAANAIAAVIPFVLMAAAIGVAIFLVGAIFNDIMAFAKGQDSILGQAAERWVFVGAAIEGVKAALNFLLDGYKELWKFISSIDWGGVFDGLVEGAISALDFVEEFLGLGGIKGANGNGKKGARGGTAGDALALGQDALSGITAAPIAAFTASNAAGGTNQEINKSTSVSIANLTIETQAGDAEGIASSITDQLTTQLQIAIDSFDDGLVS